MDDTQRLRRDVDYLHNRVLRMENERHFFGIARIYAAILPIMAIVPWFPVYEPFVSQHGTVKNYLALVSVRGPGGVLIWLLIALLAGMVLTAALRPVQTTPVLPIILTLIAISVTIPLLARVGVGAEDFPELSDTGIATLVTLLMLGLLGIIHTVMIIKIRPE